MDESKKEKELRKNVERQDAEFEEKELYLNMPPYSVFAGANTQEENSGRNKFYGTIDADSDILHEWNIISNYNKKTSAMRKFFYDAETTSVNISHQVLSAITEEHNKNVLAHLDKLKNASDPEEVLTILAEIRYGEKDKESRALLDALIHIEKTNQEVISVYRARAEAQNPHFALMRDKEEELKKRRWDTFDIDRVGGIKIIETQKPGGPRPDTAEEIQKKRERREELRKTYSKAQLLEDLKKIASSENFDFSEASQGFEKFYKPYYGVLKTHDKEKFKTKLHEDIIILEEGEKHKELQILHHQTKELAQDILVNAFQTKGSPSLIEVMGREGGPEESVRVSSDKIRRSLEKALNKMDKTLLTKDMREGILTNVVDGISGRSKDDNSPSAIDLSEAIEILNEKYDNLVPSGKKGGIPTPPDRNIEEEFQKIVEDALYNEIAKHNEYAKKYQEQYKVKLSHDNIIDIDKNVRENNYSPIGSAKDGGSDIAKKAIGLYNTNLLFQKIGKGQITKQEARHTIEQSIPFLNEHQKQSLAGNLNSFFDSKSQKLAAEDMGIDERKDPATHSGDYITEFAARNYMERRFRNSFRSALARFGITTKAAISLSACIEKGANPMETYRSSAGEISGCIDKAYEEAKRNSERADQMLSSALVALAGFASFAMIYGWYMDAEERKILLLKLKMELDREKLIDFVNGSKDIVEQDFRRKASITATSGIDEGIVTKQKYGEYVYRSLKASHDRHKEYNPFIRNGKGNIKGIIGAKNEEENAKLTREELIRISEEANLLKQVYSKREEYAKYLNTEYTDQLKQGMDNLETLLNAADNTNDPEMKEHARRESTKAYLSTLNTIEDGFKRGAVDVYKISSKLGDIKSHLDKSTEESLAIMRAEDEKLEQLKAELEEAEGKKDISRISSLKLKTSEVNKKLEEVSQRLEQFKTVEGKLKTLLIETDALIDNTIENIIEAAQKEGKTYSDAELKEKVIEALSQKNAFDMKDQDKAAFSQRMRYKGANAENAYFQDASYLDYLEREIKGKDELEVAKAILAMKTVLLESYITAKTTTDGEMGRDEAMEELFRSNSAEMLRTASVEIHAIEQDDHNTVQVATISKELGVSVVDEIKALKAQIDDPDADIGVRNHASKELEELTGVDISSSRYLDKLNKKPNIKGGVRFGGNNREANNNRERIAHQTGRDKKILDINTLFDNFEDEMTHMRSRFRSGGVR
ncbi:MAG: hypothetical protein IE916_00010 [Epsilonproteobacteria bacterium]|nr:hypothetical protein [Campylobacterota bacterium]